MKAKVDQGLCIGCGLCTQICPDVFRMDDDKAAVCLDPVPKGSEAACREAAETCPVTAIALET